MWLNRYWNNTRSPLYSFLFTVPLFIINEIGIMLSSSKDMISMRNGADALMRQILSTLGMNGFYWMGGVFFIPIAFKRKGANSLAALPLLPCFDN